MLAIMRIVAEPAVHREALLKRSSCRFEVAENERHGSDHRLRFRARALRAGAEREQLLQALARLLLMVPQLPEAPERRADLEADLRLACFQRPTERGADVVSLGVEALEPLALLRAEQARLGLLRQHEVEGGVPSSDGLAVAARRQTLERELANGLEHPQARLVPGCVLGREQVVAEERLDPLQDVEVGLLGDVLGGGKREPADEDRKAREELLLLRLQEVVAPLDRPAERPLALGETGARCRPQEIEPRAETLEQCAGAKGDCIVPRRARAPAADRRGERTAR